jgi:hypothetical protein
MWHSFQSLEPPTEAKLGLESGIVPKSLSVGIKKEKSRACT